MMYTKVEQHGHLEKRIRLTVGDVDVWVDFDDVPQTEAIRVAAAIVDGLKDYEITGLEPTLALLDYEMYVAREKEWSEM